MGDHRFESHIIPWNIQKCCRWKVTYKCRNFSPTKVFTDKLFVEILKNVVVEKWRTFSQLTKFFTDETFYRQIIRRNIKKRLWWKVTNIFRKSRNFSPTKVFTDELAVEILKNFVGERWRTFSHMTKSFTDERFTNYSIENVTHPDRSFKYGSSRLTRF